MKKLIAIAVVFALVAGVAFAQNADGISIQAWGRGAFSPLKVVTAPTDGKGNVSKGSDGKDLKDEASAGAGVTWGGNQARIDFRVNGNSDYVGFSVNAVAEDNSLRGGDNGTNLWVKPFSNDFLKLTVGTFADDTLRGKVGNLDGGFSNFVGAGVIEEDAIFTRFRIGRNPWEQSGNGSNEVGFLVSSAPMDGLYIGLMVNGELWGNTPVAHAYRYMQLGAGYNIPNIGHVRAQLIGGWAGEIDGDDEDTAKYYEADKPVRIEIAFALTAVEGLLVDLGAKINLEEKFKGTDAATTKGLAVSVGANYNSGAFGLGAHTRLSKDDKQEDGMTMVVRLVPTFALDAATLGLDVAFEIGGESKAYNGDGMKNAYTDIGFGAFVKKGLGKGHVMAGLSYKLPRSWSNGDKKDFEYVSGTFQIPVILEYYFF
jgi:hypothetical protein